MNTKILMTAPSLDENRNVSGISTVVRQIIECGNFDYRHFTAGKEDGGKQNARWILKQTALPFQLYRQIKREKIDVTHLNTALNPLSIIRDYALAKAAKRAKSPVLLHIHGGKYLAHEFENKMLEKIAAKMLESADMVLVLSELEKKIIETRWKNQKVKVLENAVALERAQPPNRVSGEKTIIYLGRLTESKGLREIVQAVKILKSENYRFNFRAFGAGDLKDVFAAEMSQILAGEFYFGGVIAGEEKWRELAKADIFLLPSRDGEGLPMAMLEAMAANCAVVVSEMASIGAVVRDGANGFLVEPKNVSQIVSKLKMILADEINLEDLQKNARETIAENFNLMDYIVKLENIYRELKGS